MEASSSSSLKGFSDESVLGPLFTVLQALNGDARTTEGVGRQLWY